MWFDSTEVLHKDDCLENPTNTVLELLPQHSIDSNGKYFKMTRTE